MEAPPLHPWVTSGESRLLGAWRFGNYEFQAWQRKNSDIFEPYADGLFVRTKTNTWKAFCLDIQDTYSPKIQLREGRGKVEILRYRVSRGIFDLETGTFRRSTNGPVFEPVDLGNNSVPPGEWWLEGVKLLKLN